MGHQANGEQVLDVAMKTTPRSKYDSIVNLDHNYFVFNFVMLLMQFS